MEIVESLRVLIQEKLLPDVNRIKEDNGKIIITLELTNKRLDDINTHLADQSRRIDAVRIELSQKIDEVRIELSQRIDKVQSVMDKRMYDMHTDLVKRLDKNNARIDQFSQMTIRRQELDRMETRMELLENEVREIKQQVAV